MTRAATPLDPAVVPYVDSRIYTDPSVFEQERQRIHARVWLPTVHESELPEPLDFRTHSIAREPIVIVRGDDGKIRAFVNVCPHRANVIVRRPAGSLRIAEPSGNAGHMTCLFHAWQFDSRGRCVDIPRCTQGYQGRLAPGDVALRELPAEVAHGGFVWVSLDENVEPLARYLAGAFDVMNSELDSEPLEVFHYHKAVVRTNYKLWHDTNSEFYHDYMHYFNRVTGMSQPGYFERRYVPHDNGHVSIGSLRVKYEAYEGAESRDLSFPGMERNGWKLVNVFPGASFNIRGSAMRVDTLTPLGPDRVLIEFRGLGLRRDSAEERARRVRDHNTIWGPFGRNLHEDLLGVAGQGAALGPGAPARRVLHGRREDHKVHDEIGMRHYYVEWARRIGRSPISLEPVA